jgi:hypothetical protein
LVEEGAVGRVRGEQGGIDSFRLAQHGSAQLQTLRTRWVGSKELLSLAARIADAGLPRAIP